MVSKEELNKIVNAPDQIEETSFNRWHNPNHKRFHRYHIRFPHVLSNVVGPKILDIGCGSGLTCYLASKRKDIKEIHGVDLQESVLEKARKNVTSDKVTFHHGFGEELNFEKGTFDSVIMTEVLEHVASVREVLQGAADMLKPKGVAVITCPFKGKLSRHHVRSIDEQFMKTRVEKHFKIIEFEIVKYPGPGPRGIFCVGVKK